MDYLDDVVKERGNKFVLREMRTRLGRSLRVIDAFLAVARLEEEPASSGHITPRVTGEQFREMLAEEIAAFQPEAAGRAKRLDLNVDSVQTGPFLFDVQVLREVLTILVDNAIRYAVTGAIRVSATLSPKEVSLTVEDNGPGLTAGMSEGQGAGLGLDLCRRLVKRSGGDLQVVRDEPDGTAFTLRLPARPAGAGAGKPL